MFSCLLQLSRFLAAHTSAFVMLVGALAFWQPGLFDWVRGNVQSALLGFIMLTMGLTLSPQDFRIVAQRPLAIALGAAAQYTIMPLLAWALVLFFLCDTVVGLQVASVGYLILPAWLNRVLFCSFPLDWLFYLPSQVMLALCGRRNRR